MNFILYFILATVPLLFGAVQPWVWSVYAGLVFAAFLAALWRGGRALWRPGALFAAAVGPFFAVTLFQCFPLPKQAAEFFSPFRLEHLAEARALIGVPLEKAGISYAPSASFAWWILLLSLVLLCGMLRQHLDHRAHLRRLVGVLLAVAVFQSIYGLLQALNPQIGTLWVDPGHASQGCARGTFINRNHFAGFLEMVWLIGLGVTLYLGEWKEQRGFKALLADEHANLQLLYLLAVVLMLLALLFSRSRAGIAGAMLGLVTFVWLVKRGTGGLRFGAWVMTGLIVVLAGVYGARMGFGPIVERFLEIGPDQSRLDVWRDSWPMVREHFWGTGLDTYRILSPVYLESIFGNRHYFYAHNDYLELLIEAGWLGAVSLVAGFFYFLVKSFRRVRQVGLARGRLRFFVGCGALAGLVSMAFHSFFDFNLQIPANAFTFVTLMSLVYSCFWEGARIAPSGDRESRALSGSFRRAGG